jgi:hypothetical protein
VIIYLVTSGCYSGYGVVAALSTEEKALEYIQHEYGEENDDSNGYGARIEEFEVDEWTPRDIYWRVRFDGRSGDLIEARQILPVGEGGYYGAWNKNRQTGQWVYEKVFSNRDSSEERAIKSAYESMMVNKNTLRYHDRRLWEELTGD